MCSIIRCGWVLRATSDSYAISNGVTLRQVIAQVVFLYINFLKRRFESRLPIVRNFHIPSGSHDACTSSIQRSRNVKKSLLARDIFPSVHKQNFVLVSNGLFLPLENISYGKDINSISLNDSLSVLVASFHVLSASETASFKGVLGGRYQRFDPIAIDLYEIPWTHGLLAYVVVTLLSKAES